MSTCQCSRHPHRRRHTPYTLWNRDRLLGESELDYISNTAEHLMGDFFPTPAGEALMPVLTGISRALLAVKRARRERCTADGVENATVDVATEYADLAEATTRFEELELQLRAPDGALIPTQSIGVTDTELLLDWSDDPVKGIDEYDDLMFEMEADSELMEAVEHDVALIEEMFEKNAGETRAAGHPIPEGDEERPFPRYQIQVQLSDSTG